MPTEQAPISPAKKNVVIGTIGTILDQRSKKAERWRRWRPSLGVCLHDDLPVDRFELIYQGPYKHLADQLTDDIRLVSPKTEIVLHQLPLRDPWDFQEIYTMLYEFAKNYTFDTQRENYYVHITTGTHVMQICWFLLTEAHYFPARLLQTSPPRKTREERAAEASAKISSGSEPSSLPNTLRDLNDQQALLPPAGTYAVIDLDLSRYDEIAKRHATEQQDNYQQLKAGIATLNPAYNQMITQIEKVAIASPAPILLNGPTGSGKSFLAKRIYQLKLSKHQLEGEFVEINCATLRGDAAMSALFGHAKGAFTGAINERGGLLKRADRGLLFLDEIGELGLDEQAMLLKAIEEKVFYPLGSDKEIQSDFQLIAGTHRDLRKWVLEGKFREDLYARINLWSYQLPGLKDRPEDIEPNIEYELQRFANLHQQQVTFNREAKTQYLAFATSQQAIWRGNFRELNASITRMATLANAGRIDEALVAEEIERLQYAWDLYQNESEPDALPSLSHNDKPNNHSANTEDLYPIDLEQLDLFDKQQLITVLSICKNSKSLSEAGRKLFSISRQDKKSPNDADRLRKYLAKFGMKWEDV